LIGNYVISGGKETVLVLYQLETGKDQKVPHLTSTILSLAVSPKGIAYAIHLADNSVIVLSTTELKPKANIPGIQSLFTSPTPSLLPQAPTLTTIIRESDDPFDSFGRTPAASNPRNLNQLLLAVPASQDGTDDSNHPASAPFLQTFDVFTDRHVTRQALARNLATTATIGPESNKLSEPNVTHIRISADGRWLATVEEWSPLSTDMEFAVYSDSGTAAEQKRRLETYLKFWRWNHDLGQWLLETRVDLPHQSKIDPFSNRVFDLVSHPSLTGFASVGEDGFVRVWKPKTRMGDGTVIRGAKAEGDITWKCTQAVELENIPAVGDDGQDFPAVSLPTNGKLAYSDDGSILAVTQESLEASKTGLVHFFDAVTGNIKYSEATLYPDGLVDIGFIGRYFVILSNDVRVWDIVTNKLVYGFKLKLPQQLTVQQRLKMSHLALNTVSNTFAIAVPTSASGQDDASLMLQDLFATVTVFDPSKPDPLIFYDTPTPVTALVSLAGSSGYIVLDSGAEYRIVNPKSSATFIASPPVKEEGQQIEPAEVDYEDVEMDEDEAEAVGGAEKDDEEDVDDMLDDDKVVVRPEQLAGIFDRGPSFALPSVKDLFDSVVGLYGRKRAA
jgi:NET1-associated nuclear protein 1 (U3 small nucleolar RNA-associated protein 17)